ncbi:hypothetical protein SBOR_8937 [Sclerotinia borealis F-4128]|uniref:Uncharacterized protein n=1 Tax=Sclerotinia borealis (strain F-4128) TaxID=1432307 RepID=W9C7W6_SCLBF|nr:hypothetical protein SBOR_8937 [Sclerotinia borealis F-4128]
MNPQQNHSVGYPYSYPYRPGTPLQSSTGTRSDLRDNNAFPNNQLPPLRNINGAWDANSGFATRRDRVDADVGRPVCIEPDVRMNGRIIADQQTGAKNDTFRAIYKQRTWIFFAKDILGRLKILITPPMLSPLVPPQITPAKYPSSLDIGKLKTSYQ